MNREIKRILLFGNNVGIPQLVKHAPVERVVGLCVSSIYQENYTDVKTFARTLGCPLFIQPEKKNRWQVLRFIRKINNSHPDLILVHSYSMKIPTEILEIPKHGAINVHYSLLPKYRGANPIQWAIINNEVKTGVTIHYMSDEIDTGDIIAQREVEIGFTDTWVDVLRKCNIVADELLSEEIPKILNGTNDRTPQDDSRATVFPRRKPHDGEFSPHTSSPLDVYNKIRALVKPHPGAFYYDGEDKIVIDEMVSYEWVEERVAERWGLSEAWEFKW